MIKPVMSEAVETDVDTALAQFRNRDLWRQWGMDTLRKQGPCILLKGPPGTGKTTIAKYMADRVKKGFKMLGMQTMDGGGEPGQTEKAVVTFFTDCKRRNNCTIFIDECDHLLCDRSTISAEGKTWQLGTVEALMMEMNQYRGLVLCATNHPQMLDAALADRFMFIIEVGMPDISMRLELWETKWPTQLPLSPSTKEFARLAKVPLNGRQIETVIINAVSDALRTNKKPQWPIFHDYALREQAKFIQKE